MPEGDVTVYYNLIPTEPSIRSASKKIVDSVNNLFAKGIGSSVENAIKGIGVRKSVYGSEGGTGESAGAGQALLASMAGSLSAILSATVVIGGALAVISAFFEAVGPIIKVVMKVLAAIILILLAPILRILLPILATFMKSAIQGAQFLAQIVTVLINVIGKWLGSLWESSQNIVEHLKKAFGKLLAGDVLGFFKELFGAAFDAIILAAKVIGGPMLTALFDVFKENLPAIEKAVNWLGEKIFGKEIWSKIWDTLTFIKDSVFSEEGIWNAIMNTLTWIGTEIFGEEGIWKKLQAFLQWINTSVFGEEGIWPKLKVKLEEINKMIDEKWSKIIDTSKEIADALIGALNYVRDLLSSAASMIGMGGGSKSGGGGGGKAGDFIWRPGGEPLAFSSSDTVVGMKDLNSLGKQNITVNNYYTISPSVDKTELKEILRQAGRDQARELRTRTSYVGGLMS